MKYMIPITTVPPTVSNVPFHSQLLEITSRTWQMQGCGITSLAMVIDYYTPGTVSVNKLLGEGIALGAYINNVGWSYNGLLSVAKKHGLGGTSYDLGKSNMTSAFSQLQTVLKDGPVIASVHYKFNPKSPLPHLVVINGIDNDTIYYNDPAGKTGEQKISTTEFQAAWKKRFIVVRPKKDSAVAMVIS